MVRSRMLHRGDLIYGGVLEPGEMLERQMQLFVTQQQPEAVLGNMSNLNRRSDVARHLEFP